jgi:biopolymer transport protein TolQ
MQLFKGNVLLELLMQSDAMTKFILAVLLFMSISCWTIFFYKAILFMVKRRQMQSALQYLKKVNTLDDIRTMAAAFTHTLPGYVIAKNLSFLKSLLELKESQLPLSEHELELLQQRVDQKIDDVIHHEESYLSILSSTAAVAPLLGLFGTIWGLVHAFVSISETQQADIATIAPGIAEALITTLAGLLVAIPSLLMFHYLNAHVKNLEKQLFNLADKLAWIVQAIFLKKQGM